MDAPKDDKFEYAMAYKLITNLISDDENQLILDDIFQLINMIDQYLGYYQKN